MKASLIMDIQTIMNDISQILKGAGIAKDGFLDLSYEDHISINKSLNKTLNKVLKIMDTELKKRKQNILTDEQLLTLQNRKKNYEDDGVIHESRIRYITLENASRYIMNKTVTDQEVIDMVDNYQPKEL